MATKADLFWIAPGVVSVNGKEHGINDALPVGDIDKAKLKRWKEARPPKVGTKIAPVVKDGRDNQIADLKTELAEVTIGAKKTIKGLEKDLKDADGGDCEDCKEKGLRIEELDSEVERLAGENTGLSVDVEEKAALIGDLKADAEKLEKELEEATKPAGDKKK